jgi:lipopolysaccharide/colanic/teichoic acid biosynthesis glycosyltransferase
MDVAYARGWSLGLDLRLICRTPLQVLGGRKATA